MPAESKMDPEDTYLGRMLVEEITPAVMVLQTPMVEEACQKNGLNFVQMLSPFCLFNKIDGDYLLLFSFFKNELNCFKQLELILEVLFVQYLYVPQVINPIGCRCSSCG